VLYALRDPREGTLVGAYADQWDPTLRSDGNEMCRQRRGAGGPDDDEWSSPVFVDIPGSVIRA
jgi:hypothetical protein